MKDFIPAALRSQRLYDGKLYTRKDLLDHLILEEGFTEKKIVKRATGEAYCLVSPYGHKLTFAAKAERAYIDKLLKKVNEGAAVEMEHKNTIEAIKRPGIKTKQAAKLIAADHIAEKRNYYNELETAKLEDGGKLKDNFQGSDYFYKSIGIKNKQVFFSSIYANRTLYDKAEAKLNSDRMNNKLNDWPKYINDVMATLFSLYFSNNENHIELKNFKSRQEFFDFAINKMYSFDAAKLEKGGPIEAQDLSKGTVLQGPSHEGGGIEIQVNNKPVAEAEGGEVVINAENSKLFCEELSEINQRNGNGKALNCDEKCDTCDHTMASGGKIATKKEFQIQKAGITDGKVTILSKDGENFNREEKIKKYLYLGYNVYDMDGTQINKEGVIISNGGRIPISEVNDKTFYFEPSTGKFYVNVIDAVGNRTNNLNYNTIYDFLQANPNARLNAKGQELFPEADDYELMANGGQLNGDEIIISDFRPQLRDSNKIIIKKSVVYYAGMPIHTLKKENATGYFGSKYLYSAISGSQNMNIGTIALQDNDIETIKNKVKNFNIIEMQTNNKYKIGDEVLYKDVNGDYTLKSKIASILPANTVNGQPLTEYALAAGGAYTEDELKPVMAKGDIIDGGDLYSGSNATKQMKKELVAKFPSIKFSVRYQSYSGGDSARASWNFGPTTDEVDSVIDKYQYGRFDGMTDSYEYNKDETKLVTPEGVVKNFGGVKYVSSDRDAILNNGKTGNEQWESETSIQLLIAKDLAKLNGVEWIGAYTLIPNWGRDTAKDHAYRILRKNSFDTDNVTSYDGLEATGVSGGQIEDLYKIKYNGNKVTVNKDAEKSIADDLEFERTRPEREAKEKADRAKYELAEAENQKLLNELSIKQYDMLNDDEVSNRMENVSWPGSKLSNLDEYKKSLKEDRAEKLNINRATVIKQVIIANDKDFNTLSNNLMNSLPHVWKRIGGTGIPDEILIENGIDPTKVLMSSLTSDQIKKLMPYFFSIGTLVFNEDTKESFVADCQGYDYARYIGFPMDKSEVEKMLLQIKVDSISKFEKMVAEIPEKDFEEMKQNSGVPEFQKQGPINLNKPTNWNQLPSAWKVVKNIPAIAFDNSPKDKNLIKIVEPFLGSDQFRPVLSGVKFGEDGITATDAHKFIHLPYPNKDFDGIYNVQPKVKFFDGELKGDLIQGNYPNYPKILPNGNEVYKVSVLKLKTFVNAISAGKYNNQITHRVLLNGSKDTGGKVTTHAFNGNFLMLILNTCLKLGKEIVYFGASTSNKAVIIAFDAETAKNPQSKLGKETIMLLMPIFDYENDTFQNGMIAGAVDQDFDKEFKIAYSLVDDNIYNFDGTIALFDFNLTKAKDTDLTTQQEKIVNAYKLKNNVLPILDGVLINENKLYVTDLENTAIINNVNKADNVYYYINSAMVPYNSNEENVSDEFPKHPALSEFKKLGSINRLELLFNISKCNLCVGNDDLRPQFNGVHFVKEKDSNKLIVEATDAHVLFRNEIKNHNIENDFHAIVPATKKLSIFLENTFDENVEVFMSGVNIMFKTSTATVISRIIPEKYPNVLAVIPRLYEKTFTLDITNLKECIKSITKEEKKRQAHLHFKNVVDGIIKIDLFNWVSEGGKAHEHVFIRELCQVKASVVTKQKQGKDFVFLGMPTLKNNDESEYPFALRTEILETFIKITESDKLVIDYTASNKALTLSDSEFKQIAQPVNLPKPATKAPKPKDEIEMIAEKQEVAHKKEKSKQAVKKVVSDDTKTKKIKLATAKAAARARRLRILTILK